MRTVKRYWVFQFHVMLEDAFIVKVIDAVVPDAETLPVPVHPVHTYLVPVGPDTGDVTDVLTVSSASYHPLVTVGEPLREVTIR